MPDRPVAPQSREEEAVLDRALRPTLLAEFPGQDRLTENLGILIQAARERGEALDHILFYGPPGLGKTSLAHIVANEMKVNVRVTAGPAIERTGDLAAILTNLKAGGVPCNIALAFNPFELFLEFGQRIKAQSLAQQTFVVQLANGVGGYLPTHRAEQLGGYGGLVINGQVNSEGGDRLVAETVALIHRLFVEP